MCEDCYRAPVIHTVEEWARMPDLTSERGRWYVYEDYRTDNDVNVARFKFGDGKTVVRLLPFVTAAITDNDTEFWDNKADGNSDFGKPVTIGEELTKYTFPTDGYLMLKFKEEGYEFAEVKLFGASGKSFFTFSKYTDRDSQSKEVYVRRGMKCEYVGSSENAEIVFVPLV